MALVIRDSLFFFNLGFYGHIRTEERITTYYGIIKYCAELNFRLFRVRVNARILIPAKLPNVKICPNRKIHCGNLFPREYVICGVFAKMCPREVM